MRLMNMPTKIDPFLGIKWNSVLLRPTVLTLFAGALLTIANSAYAAGPVVVSWSGCPGAGQWGQYNFPSPGDFSNGVADPYPAHAEPFPVAAPTGGNCSLDVVSGTRMSIATSAGGVALETPGEVAGATYTIAFDMQWVSGENPWSFSNQEGNGVQNGLTFQVTYPGDNCWHRYEFTGDVGPIGPKTVMFVYQVSSLQEMRIANLVIREVDSDAPKGLVVSGAEGHCCEREAKGR